VLEGELRLGTLNSTLGGGKREGEGFDNSIAPSVLLEVLICSMLETLSANTAQKGNSFTAYNANISILHILRTKE
jgi:hypothetical protein